MINNQTTKKATLNSFFNVAFFSYAHYLQLKCLEIITHINHFYTPQDCRLIYYY